MLFWKSANRTSPTIPSCSSSAVAAHGVEDPGAARRAHRLLRGVEVDHLLPEERVDELVTLRQAHRIGCARRAMLPVRPTKRSKSSRTSASAYGRVFGDRRSCVAVGRDQGEALGHRLLLVIRGRPQVRSASASVGVTLDAAPSSRGCRRASMSEASRSASSGGSDPSSSVKPYSRASAARPVGAAGAGEDVGIGRQRDDRPAVELRALAEADVEPVKLAAPVLSDGRVREQSLGEHETGPQRHDGNSVRLQLEGRVARDLVDRGLAGAVRTRTAGTPRRRATRC